MEEIWSAIPDYEDCYEVSTHGNIRSVERCSESYGGRICMRAGRTLSQNTAPTYNTISLSKEGIVITKTIHRLVALTFLPNPDNLPEVDHIDRNRRNNHISNLRWVSKVQNQANRGIPIHNTSGEMYIRYIEKTDRYKLQIKRADLKVQKYYKTLQEAREERKRLLGF